MTTIALHDLPAATSNKLYLDYIAGTGQAAQFFTHAPADFARALDARREHRYPRQEVVPLLAKYNARLGASEQVLSNIEALREPETFCVITGQQAGFLGGPAYTVYKTVTTIRLAAYLQKELGARVVPVFWLATEDHDFGEVNHTFRIRRDGEVGRVAFGWAQEGRPIAALPITDEVTRAFDDYWSEVRPGPHLAQVRELFTPRPQEDYATWYARLWSELFSAHGLVIVEPRTLRPLAGEFFQLALSHGQEIRRRLDEVAQKLLDVGYEPQLTSENAGQMYTFDHDGFRVRVDEPQMHLDVAAHPERYSTDAALRPLFADAMLPVAISVLGPGETAYQAMLRPLYELFELPQPLLVPRKSYTVVSKREAERLALYQASARAILTEQIDTDAIFRNLVPVDELELFATAQRGLADALSPLRPYLKGVDPSLNKTWAQTLANADRNLGKLRERTFKARMSQLGFSKGELRRLRNALLPRGRLQERVLPLPHFLNRHGLGFMDHLLSAGALDDYGHHILTLEEAHA